MEIINIESVVNGAGPSNLAIDEYEKHCIHKVPRNLRKVNDEAYTPQLISIGPYHCYKEELADMRMHKRRYKTEFYERIIPDKRQELKNFIKKDENLRRIYRYYAERSSQFETEEFVEMILLDAVFIIELFLRSFFRHKNDFLLNEVSLAAIRRDLWLLENQLPYFVLDELHKLASTYCTQNEVYHFAQPFGDLSGAFFQLHPLRNRPHPMQTVKHFTDLCRYALVGIPQNAESEVSLTSRPALPNAVKLKNSGVKFQLNCDEYLVHIHCERPKGPMPFANKIKLQIPRIEITDNTECFIRNLTALEVCQYPYETNICSYIFLMDSLINTEQDVDLLVEEGIIYNPQGDYSVTSTMFNKLCKQIPRSYSHYNKTYEDLSIHYGSGWNHAMETLGSVYFPNPWRSTATVAAIILLLLTLAQTVASILQVV